MTTVNGIFNKVTDFKPIYCLPVKELLVGSFSHNRQNFLTSSQGVAHSTRKEWTLGKGFSKFLLASVFLSLFVHTAEGVTFSESPFLLYSHFQSGWPLSWPLFCSVHEKASMSLLIISSFPEITQLHSLPRFDSGNLLQYWLYNLSVAPLKLSNASHLSLFNPPSHYVWMIKGNKIVAKHIDLNDCWTLGELLVPTLSPNLRSSKWSSSTGINLRKLYMLKC